MPISMSVSNRETAMAAPVVPRRRRRPTGLLLPLIAIVLVIGGIAVVADRAAAKAASDELKSRIAAELVSREITYSSLDVAIGGTPFLIQVAQGRYESIRIDMTEIRIPARADRFADVPELHVVASGVHAGAEDLVQGTGSVVADEITGTAVISYATLTRLLDLSAYRLSEVTFSESDGAVKATASADMAGVHVPIEALADVSVVDRAIQVRFRDARAIGVPVPSLAKGFLNDLVSDTLVAQMPTLPFGLVLDGLTAAAEGLAVTVTGQDVTLVNRGSGQ